MKSILHHIFCGKENKANGLFALCVVSLIVLGCTCNISNPWQKENNSTPAPAANTSTQPKESETPPDKTSNSPAVTETPLAAPVKTPEPPNAANFPPPVETAYAHFIQEARRRLGKSLKIGSPRRSGTRIEVSVEADGEAETLVVLQKSNDGHKATVIVGPKEAGAVRSYTLTLGANGWKITNFKDLNG
jgi:hypothetical protein